MQVVLELDSETARNTLTASKNKVTHWSGTHTFILKLEETQESTGEMAQSVKCLPHERRNLRMSPRAHI